MINITNGPIADLGSVAAPDDIWLFYVDSLLVGPSDISPIVHDTLRRHYFSAIHHDCTDIHKEFSNVAHLDNCQIASADDLLRTLSPHEQCSHSVQLWVSERPSCYLFLWWVIANLKRLPRDSVVLTVSSISTSGAGYDDICHNPLGSQLIPFETRTIGDALWTAFAKGDVLCLHSFIGDLAIDDTLGLKCVMKYFVKMFPRWENDRLQLSDLDSSLLIRLMSGKWMSAAAIIATMPDEISCYGDIFLNFRLSQWACHNRNGLVVEHKFLPDMPSNFTRHRYRLTRKGQNIVRNGLRELSDAPKCPTGGCIPYDETCRWVVDCNDGFIWWGASR